MFTETRRLVVVAAHPDDLETMCGGALIQLVRRGVQVLQILCTSGNIGSHESDRFTRASLAAQREAETRAAADLLGISDCLFLGRDDGELVADLALRAELAWHYRRFQPDTLWTFDPWWPGQAHPDHRAAGQAAIDAYMPAKMPLYHPEQLAEGVTVCQSLTNVYFFGGSSREMFYVDISEVWAEKVAAALKHESQFKDEAGLAWLAQMNRAAGRVAGVPYAEPFARLEVW